MSKKSIAILLIIACLSSIYIQIQAQSTLTGTVYYNNGIQTAVDGIKVYLATTSGTIIDSSYTTSSGTFSLDNIVQGQYHFIPVCSKPWGGGNAVDALLIMQHFAGMALLTDVNFLSADVNNSHTVNSVDALLVMKRFTGLQNSFITGDWVFSDDSISIDGTNSYQLDIKGLCAGDVNASHSPPASPCSPFWYGAQWYETVEIGNQCWMKQNLNIGIMVFDDNTGTSHTHCSNNGIIQKYCYNNDPWMCEIWGGLYDWNEMMNYSTVAGSQGICPGGWHIPTDTEFCVLTTSLDQTTNCSAWGYSGTNASGKMKEQGTAHWHLPNAGATNESGFTSIASGYRHFNGFNGSLLDGAYIWCSTEYNAAQGITRNLGMYNADISRYHYVKNYGFTVRCIKD